MAEGLNPIRLQFACDFSQADREVADFAARSTKTLNTVFAALGKANIHPSQLPPNVQNIINQFHQQTGGHTVNNINNQTNSLNAVNNQMARLPGLSSRASASLVNLASVIYTTRAAFNFIDQFAIKPWEDLARKIGEATEAARLFEYRIGAITGSDKARQIASIVNTATQNIPQPLSQLRESVAAFALNPNFSAQLSGQSAQQGAAAALQYNDIIRKLAFIAPAGGDQLAESAVKSLVAGGNPFALKRGYGISADQIAAAIGKTTADLKADPNLALAGLQKVVDAIAPASAVDRAQSLISVRVQHVKDAISIGLAKIGDSHAYDQAAQKVGHLSDEIFRYINSDHFKADAERIGADIGHITDNIASAIDRFFRRLSGAGPQTSTVEAGVKAFGSGIHSLAALSDSLPSSIEHAGAILHDVAASIKHYIDDIATIADAARNPGKYAREVVAGAASGDYGSAPAGYNASTFQTTRALFQKAGIDTDHDLGLGFLTDSQRELSALWHGGGLFAPIGDMAKIKLGEASDTVSPDYFDTHRLPPYVRGLADEIQRRVINKDAVPAELQQQLADAVQSWHSGDDLRGIVQGMRDEFARNLARRLPSTRPTSQPSFFDSVTRLHFGEFGDSRFYAPIVAATQPTTQPNTAPTSQPTTQPTPEIPNYQATVISLLTSNLVKEVKDALADALADAKHSLSPGVFGLLDYQRANSVPSPENDYAYNSARQSAGARIKENASAITKEIFDQLARAPGSAEILQRLASGGADFQLNALAALRSHGIEASAADVTAKTIAEQQAQTAQLINRAVQDFKAAPLGARAGQTPADLDRVYSQLPKLNPSGDELALYSKLLSVQGGVLDRANAEYAKTPNLVTERDAASAAVQYAELVQKVRDLKIAADPLASTFKQFGDSAREAVGSGLGHALSDVILQTGKVSEAFRAMGREIINAFSDILAHQAVNAVLGAFFPGGNVFSAFIPQAHADGGVFGAPHIGLIGEAGPEAIVPMAGQRIPLVMRGGEVHVQLPKGRSIPTAMRAYADGGIAGGGFTALGYDFGPGGGGAIPLSTAHAMQSDSLNRIEQKIFVVASYDEALRRGLRRHRDTVIDVVAGSVEKGSALSKAIKRMN